MRKIRCALSVALLIGLASALTGCAQSRQVENQAYALVLGVDLAKDGQLEMTIKIPKIVGGDSGGEASSGGGSDSYTQVTATGENYDACLQRLEWAVPRNLNLSQLKLLILSREMAESELCRHILSATVRTERLFASAHVVVCEGKAREFVTMLKATMGTRLSSDITATFEHYADQGLIPESTLADLYYQTESVYSDPVAVYADVAKASADSSSAKPAAALSGSPKEEAKMAEGEPETRYLGTALFREGRMIGTLSGDQTTAFGLLTGSVHHFRYDCQGKKLEISPTGTPGLSVDLDAEPAVLRVGLNLTINAPEGRPDEQALRNALESDLLSVIRTLQELRVEPCGFSEAAAGKYLTLARWNASGWRDRCNAADVEINIRLRYMDA